VRTSSGFHPSLGELVLGMFYAGISFSNASGDLEEAYAEKRQESGPAEGSAWLGRNS